MKTILLIDGENFKRKIKSVFKEAGKEELAYHEYDFRSLFDKVLSGLKIDKTIIYFAKIKEDPRTIEKSKQLIEEQRLLKSHLEKQGFETMPSGRVRGHIEKCPKGHEVLTFKEKGVDVRIAVDMISLACDKKVKEIILGSSDSDLQPAITEIKKRGVSCVYLGFESLPNIGISYNANRTILIRNSEILECEKIKNLFS
jgi:uncharacterized LabA/DUF88 family protein